ncbi:MAG: peptidoglycan DD-metalloendopeptidase family protein [Gammaproteobacteria bacterium]|nr:peptidoglycan DD-metalloendopeptidase family protein [Gammaproteobacteria bacterium]MBA3563210.1 peptidoglycan DD-metalloendopeptidase family protein [Gammaproteobacteria bacterium]
MRLWTYAAAAAILTACTAQQPPEGELTLESHAAYADSLRKSGLAGTLLGSQWLEAAGQALQAPLAIELPFGEQGAFLAHRPRAEAFAFEAVENQQLVVTVSTAAGPKPRLFADFFQAFPGADAAPTEWRKLDSLPAESTELRFEIPASGRYLLRLQPELLAASAYRLEVEIEAVWPFPVQEHDITAVMSFFGDARDGGRRQHEGVDIFAPRGTPVLAVAGGLATPRESRLGGKTVWLRSRGASYYYAHLDSFAVSSYARVDAGDVLGYIGNTGNARTTAPHLHFGVYRRRSGAIDPLPLLRSWQLAETAADAGFEAHEVRVTASRLNVRGLPDGQAPVLQQIERGTLVHARAIAGQWTRVALADGTQGWIASRFREPVARSFASSAPTVRLRNRYY